MFFNSSAIDLLALLLILAYFLEVPRSIGISDASIVSFANQAQAVSSSKKVQGSLKSGDEVKVKTDTQIAGALSSMFDGLSDPSHRRSFALMRRIRDLPGFMATILRATGYQVGAGLADIVNKATYLLRMALVIVPAQVVNNESIDFQSASVELCHTVMKTR